MKPTFSREERFVRAPDGTELFYEKVGVGRTLLFCDGLLCDGHIWKYLFPALENDFELVHWHYPGHGRSGEPPRFADLSPGRLADDVAQIARTVARDGITLIGHSMGVQVALEAWRRHRDLVRALVLVCGSPGSLIQNFHEGPMLGYLLPVLDAVGRFTPHLISKAWQRLPAELLARAAKYSREINPRWVKESDLVTYFGGLKRVDHRIAVQMIESAGRHDATPYLHEVDVPALIIAGSEDRFTPAYMSEKMARLMPRSELTMVDGGTHSLPIEQPELVELRIRRFLTELD